MRALGLSKKPLLWTRSEVAPSLGKPVVTKKFFDVPSLMYLDAAILGPADLESQEANALLLRNPR